MPTLPVSNSLPKPPEPVVAAGGKTGAAILGTGSYLPARIMTNAEMESMVETSDEWITSRTGIKERRIAAEGEHTSDIGAAAALAALAHAGVEAGEVDLILVATASPDMFFPATACIIQKLIGANRAACMDVSAVSCTPSRWPATWLTPGRSDMH